MHELPTRNAVEQCRGRRKQREHNGTTQKGGRRQRELSGQRERCSHPKQWLQLQLRAALGRIGSKVQPTHLRDLSSLGMDYGSEGEDQTCN